MPPPMSARLSDPDLLARLVAHASVSTESATPIADDVCEYVDRSGVVITRDANDDATKVNVVARIGPDGGDDRRGLVLSGHLDVVPADEPGWTSDPFRLRAEHGRLYGRGACDMKGFVALAMNIFGATTP